MDKEIVMTSLYAFGFGVIGGVRWVLYNLNIWNLEKVNKHEK